MDLTTEMEAACPPERLFDVMADLARYPEWLEIVARAVPETGEGAGPAGGIDPAWSVDLRAKVGPFSRSKRLRMVRTVGEAPTAVRFERVEFDERDHSPWVLAAELAPTSIGTRLAIHLHYGGNLFGGVVERLLRDEVEQSKVRLRKLVEA